MRDFRTSCTTAALLIVGLLFCGAAAPSQPVPLFNGKNLDGWRYYLADHAVGMDDVWSVKDGAIVCKGEPLGYLYTTKAYKNYKLHVEYRWAPGKPAGNSGIFNRITGKPQALPQCIEAQLKAGSAGDMVALSGIKITGPADRIKEVKRPGIDAIILTKTGGQEKPSGEWNTVEIEVQGSTMKVWVNGALANEAKDLEVAAGAIGLQSEGGEIHFRNVVVTELGE